MIIDKAIVFILNNLFQCLFGHIHATISNFTKFLDMANVVAFAIDFAKESKRFYLKNNLFWYRFDLVF